MHSIFSNIGKHVNYSTSAIGISHVSNTNYHAKIPGKILMNVGYNVTKNDSYNTPTDK